MANVMEMQIQTTVQYYFIPTRMRLWKGKIVSNTGKDMEQPELSDFASRNILDTTTWAQSVIQQFHSYLYTQHKYTYVCI